MFSFVVSCMLLIKLELIEFSKLSTLKCRFPGGIHGSVSDNSCVTQWGVEKVGLELNLQGFLQNPVCDGCGAARGEPSFRLTLIGAEYYGLPWDIFIRELASFNGAELYVISLHSPVYMCCWGCFTQFWKIPRWSNKGPVQDHQKKETARSQPTNPFIESNSDTYRLSEKQETQSIGTVTWLDPVPVALNQLKGQF